MGWQDGWDISLKGIISKIGSFFTNVHGYPSCYLATTTNISLSGTSTPIDDEPIYDGDRILVKDQTNATENGIYIAKTGTWIRSPDMDEDEEVIDASIVFIEEGTVNNSTGWMVSNPNPITIGVTDIVWVKFTSNGAAGDIIAGDGLVKTGSVLDVVANADGSILSNINDIQVGILATDIQHGSRGGGSQHSIATTISNGFMSASQVTQLNATITEYEFLLESDPDDENITYVDIYSGGLISYETWTRVTGSLLRKRIDYTYNPGRTVNTEVIKIYQDNGITIGAQMTITFSYSGGYLTGASRVRDI